MNRISIGLGLAAVGLELSVASLWADFVLTGTDYMEVTTYHSYGLMYDASTAWVHTGGRVDRLETYNGAMVRIGSEGYVGALKAYDQSQATLPSGTVTSLSLYGQSLLQIDGGQVNSVHLFMEAFGPLRLTMRSGRILYLSPSLRLDDNDQVTWSGRISDLTPHGIQILGGTIHIIRPSFTAYQASQLNIAAGQVRSIDARDQSTVNLSGSGTVDSVSLDGQSLLQIKGGQVSAVHLFTEAFGPLRLAMQSGRISYLGLSLRLDDAEQVTWNGQVSSLGPHGIQVTGGTIDSIRLNAVTAYQSSRLDITGGQTGSVQAYDQSTVNISGGEIYVISTSRSSTLHISGGVVNWLSATGQVNISAGNVSGFTLSGNATANVAGGQIDSVHTNGTAQLTLSGGTITELMAYAQSLVTFQGYDFLASEGLSIEGNLVLGTGRLSGKWSDGTPWQTWIDHHDPQAIIRTAACLLGDTNFDGVVDLADYNNVVNNLGAGSFLGDTNGDGVVDLADYNNVVNNLGTSAPARLAVPEPATVGLLAGPVLIGLLRRRHH